MGRDEDRVLGAEELGSLAQGVVRSLAGGDVIQGGSSAALDAMRARDEHALAEARERRRRAVREATLAVLPPKIRTMLAAGNAEDTPAVKALRAWEASSQRPRLFMIRGGVGVGKSVAAACAIQTCVDAGRTSVSWHRPNDFVSAVLHAYDERSPKVGRDMVVVDDIGRETKTDFCEALSAFLDDYDSPIVITTNLTRDQLRERYDVRLIDRLKAEGHAVDIRGESRRNPTGNF